MATRNALFAILNVSLPTVVENRLAQLASSISLPLAQPGQWLLIVPSTTTTQELSEKLGFQGGDSSGIVVRVDTYSGRSAPSVWEWIRTKLEADLDSKTTA